MSQLVHVIGPDGTRWEREFSDKDSDSQILASLRSFNSKFLIGYVGRIRKTDVQTGFENIEHQDRESGLVMDDPRTAIVIGRDEGNRFIEIRRLAGPSVAATAESDK